MHARSNELESWARKLDQEKLCLKANSRTHASIFTLTYTYNHTHTSKFTHAHAPRYFTSTHTHHIHIHSPSPSHARTHTHTHTHTHKPHILTQTHNNTGLPTWTSTRSLVGNRLVIVGKMAILLLMKLSWKERVLLWLWRHDLQFFLKKFLRFGKLMIFLIWSFDYFPERS